MKYRRNLDSGTLRAYNVIDVTGLDFDLVAGIAS